MESRREMPDYDARVTAARYWHERKDEGIKSAAEMTNADRAGQEGSRSMANEYAYRVIDNKVYSTYSMFDAQCPCTD